jgi:glycosyltransferase involved in cell wall biosynthesis
VGEDASTDGTRAIVERVASENPGLIVPILRENNMGAAANHTDLLARCRGKYIALLDGDDYWTDPLKLQKQVDYLEAHPECSGCCSDAFLLDEATGGRTLHRPYGEQPLYRFGDFLNGNMVCTPTVMYRRGLFGDFPAWYSQVPSGDWVIHLLNTLSGPYGYLPEPMAVYRVHGGGSWQGRSQSQRLKGVETLYRGIEGHFPPQYRAGIRRRRLGAVFAVAIALEQEGRPDEAKRRLGELWFTWPSSRAVPLVEILKLTLRLHAPRLYQALKRRFGRRAPTAAGW